MVSLESVSASTIQQVIDDTSLKGDEAVLALTKSFQLADWSNLKTLELSWTGVGDKGVVALAESFQSAVWSKLETLDLSWTNVGDGGLVALAESFKSGHLSNLRILDLSWSHVRVEGVAALATAIQSDHLSNLKTLSLSRTPVGDEGVTALAKAFQSGHLSNLEILNLSWCEVEDEGLVALAKAFQSGHFNKLEKLDLSGNLARREGIEEIARTLKSQGNLPSLRKLELYPLKGARTVSLGADRALISAYQENKLLVVQIDESSKPVERMRQRNQRAVAILRELQDEPNLPGNHGKVFLCGNANAGKTTLRLTLVRPRWKAKVTSERRSRKEGRTRGIELSHMESEKEFSDGRPLKLAIWDLAGQSEYHVLHSAFLPDLAFADGQATFFVIVCSTEISVVSAEKDLLYWLRFISSNSAKWVDKGLRRQVFVVVNCFEGNLRGHDQKEWTDFLAECSQKFAAFLNVHPHPFVLDARVASEVKSFKRELKQQAKEMLRNRPMPRICLRVQDVTREWALKNRAYPVLGWQKYSSTLFGRNITEEKLKAATIYLHEAGHVILFREGALIDGGLPHEALVILDPEWFCQRVVGHLLLPDSMVLPGESILRLRMGSDGSLPTSTLQNKLDVPPEKVEEVVAILLRLGLCYYGNPRTDKIFVPALIGRDDARDWLSVTNEQAWVMGFSLVLKDSATTVLPIALLRKLQVVLALDSAIGGRSDCRFTSGKSLVTFRSQGMAILVECSAGVTDLQQDRLDILVKPLVDDSDEDTYTETRQRQVDLAQNIVEKVMGISLECCPGVELAKKIVKPWSSADLLPPLNKRDVLTSAEDVIARMKEHGGQSMNWRVGNVLVKEEELLPEGDLHELRMFMEGKCDLIIQVVEDFGLSKYPEVSENFIKEFTNAEPQTSVVLGHRDKRIEELYVAVKEVRDVVKEVRDVITDLRDVVEDVRAGLQLALKQKKSLVRSIQSLERFSVEDKESSVPRFAYLAEVGKPSVWMKLSKALTNDFVLHFLCEASYSDQTIHEVDGQVGVDISRLKDWAQKLAPIIDWSLKIAFVAAKIAGTAVLPGLGSLAPGLPPGLLSNGSQTINAIADLFESSSTAFTSSLDHQSVLNSQAESLGKVGSRTGTETYLHRRQQSLTEIRGTARAAVKEILDGLSIQEFKQQVGLRRVRISDAYGGTRHVIWICHKCFGEYGTKAREI